MRTRRGVAQPRRLTREYSRRLTHPEEGTYVVPSKYQDVCPFNRFSSDSSWSELAPDAGAGPRLDLVELLSISTDEEFRARFKGTPLTRPKRRGLLRNAAVVARNIECNAAVPALIERVTRDPEPLIRSHALWAVAQLDPQKGKRLIDQSLIDPDPLVHEEASLLKSEEIY